VTTPRRKYVRQMQTLSSFIEPMPTDRLIWLAKMALDEVTKRAQVAERSTKVVTSKPREFQQHRRTLR